MRYAESVETGREECRHFDTFIDRVNFKMPENGLIVSKKNPLLRGMIKFVFQGNIGLPDKPGVDGSFYKYLLSSSSSSSGGGRYLADGIMIVVA